MQDTFARATHSAKRATIGYRVNNQARGPSREFGIKFIITDIIVHFGTSLALRGHNPSKIFL